MKSDNTRDTFFPPTDRRTVRFQQGRLPLDADLNEGQDLLISRVETEARDVIGPSGGPEDNAGFDITIEDTGESLAADAGRYYVDGILCRLEEDTPLTNQADLPGFELPTDEGLYLAYLDVSFDHLTAREDASIQEVALNGADTCTRQRIKSQVRLLQVSDQPDDSFGCDEDLEAWDALVAGPTGSAAARAEPEAFPENECSMTPGAGYRDLLNHLYRLEVHDPGDQTSATYKWSRENGSILAHWQAKDGDDLIVEPQGRDPHRLFKPGGWVELIDRERELREEPGTLVQVINVRDNTLTIDPATATGPVDLGSFQTLPRVRRWESQGALPLNHDPDADGFSPLEFGVQARFADGTYNTGDHWLIPARTATGDVEWPRDETTSEPLLQPRRGIEHHYARLAVVSFDGSVWTKVSDCRALFPPLTDLDHCDLKLHNKHLHGKGVVCGLQVNCGGDTDVVIRKGHAIDCEGTDILHKEETTFPLVAGAQELDLLDQNGDGEVLLTLTADAEEKPVFGLREAPEVPEDLNDIIQHILEGTIWMDFYRDCLKPLVDFIKERFIGNDDEDDDVPGSLVSEKKKDLITVANLAAHQQNIGPSRRLWLSEAQHERLRSLYEGLLEFAAGSKTFCGIEDSFPQFPDYPFGTAPIRVGFAGRRLNGARVSPHGTRAYAWSDDEPGRFFIFDAQKGEMTHHIELSSAGSMRIRDVTFVTIRGKQAVLVLSANNVLSVLSPLDPESLQPTGAAVFLQGGSLNTMQADPRDDSMLIAVEPGKGVHFLNLANIRSRNMPDPAWSFPAAGHFSIGGDQIAATTVVGDTSLPAGTYNAVVLRALSTRNDDVIGTDPVLINRLGSSFNTGSDGLVFAQSGQGLHLHIVVDPPTGRTQKAVIVTNPSLHGSNSVRSLPVADDGSNQTGPVHLLNLDRDGRVVYALTKRNQLLWGPSTGTSAELRGSSLPAQAQPIALASGGPVAESFIIAHAEGATLMPVGTELLDQATLEDTVIGNYRDSLIDAFQQILIPILQSLKDCLCDKLMIDCPECGEDEFLPLARIEIRGNEVYHICNRARKELLTFPKVIYWCSAVPILPFLRFLIDKFCCWILPVSAAAGGGGARGASEFTATKALVGMLQPGNARKLTRLLGNNVTRYGAFGRLSIDKTFREVFAEPGTAPVEKKAAAEILGRDAERTMDDLEKAGIEVVEVKSYDAALRNEPEILNIRDLPQDVRFGEKVELYTRNDSVAFFRRVSETEGKPDSGATIPDDTEIPREDSIPLSILEKTSREFQEKLDALQKTVSEQESTIADLRKTNLEDKEKRAEELDELRHTMEADRETISQLGKTNRELITNMDKSTKSLRKELESIRKKITNPPPRG